MERCVPSDLIAEILCRLPVKSLVRFRCVSKRCCSEINNQDFIRFHLKRSSHTNSLVIVDHKTLSLVDLSNNPSYITRETNNYLEELFSSPSVNLIGTCNGLLCFCSSNCSRIVLLNVSTREHITLPPQPDPDNFGVPGYKLFGFGYDPVNDDYRVIRIREAGPQHKVISYSLRSKSWRMISGIRNWYCMNPEVRGVYVNGAIHWLVCRMIFDTEDLFIVAIDLVTDKQRILGLPDKYKDFKEAKNPYPPGFPFRTLGVLGGHLCAMNYDDSLDSVGIWVMKKYGMTESWTCLFSIPRIGRGINRRFCRRDSNSPSSFVHPLAYSENGDEVLVGIGEAKQLYYSNSRIKDTKLLYYYNLESGFVRPVNIPNLHTVSLLQIQICQQSLVPLNTERGQ